LQFAPELGWETAASRTVELKAGDHCIEFHDVALKPCTAVEFAAFLLSSSREITFNSIKLSVEDGRWACE
jgi:hypothetical protein